ncbi:melanization protease 1-like [Drosophila subpulchrella]|uniref:melanization protease 1-like n=1 Tax=Drosophila subpulchrella TaxID=1486046 RepID=UPI0018A1A7CA|nr:melanization protease 1-like [Drosophila subpulchrella]
MKIIVAGIVVTAFLFLGTHKGSASLLEDNCGTTRCPLRIRRVVGGNEAERFSNPWMVMLLSDDGFKCGGSLITSRFVLTAAHCISELPAIKVRLGVFDLDISEHTYEVDIDRSISHPQHKISDMRKYDIALLRMAHEVGFSDYIRPICLLVNQKEERIYPNYKLTGWGSTGNDRMNKTLHTTNIFNFGLDICNQQFWEQTDQSVICAGSLSSNACDGDGGSPLSAELDYEGTIREFQLGIASYGTTSCLGVGVFTNVSHYINWINYTILANSD